MAQLATMRWYWCDKCQKHAQPADIGFRPLSPTTISDDCPREIVLMYHCDCHHVWGLIPLVLGTDGLLWPDYQVYS